jgi:hypothetical protein
MVILRLLLVATSLIVAVAITRAASIIMAIVVVET